MNLKIFIYLFEKLKRKNTEISFILKKKINFLELFPQYKCYNYKTLEIFII